MGKRGPKTLTLDWEQFDKLCAIQCTLREIAAWFDMSEDSIERICEREKGLKFAEYFERKKGFGKVSLRRRMYETAMKGNVTMQIWLSKQHLGMTDKIEQHNDTKFSVPISISVDKLQAIVKSDMFLSADLKALENAEDKTESDT